MGTDTVALASAAQKLHELISLHAQDEGLGEVRRLASIGVEGVDAQHAKVLGRKVADWSLDQLGGELRQAFDVDAFELLAQGWAQVRKVHQAAKASLGPPPRPQTVTLLKHDLEARVEPRLVLQVGGLDWYDVKLALVLKLSVEAAQLEFLDGQWVSLTLAKPTGSIALLCEGQEVAAAKRSLKLHEAYRLDPPRRWPGLATAAAH